MVPVIDVLAQYDGFGIEPLQEAVGGRATGTTFGGEEFHQDGCAGRIRRGSRQQQGETGNKGQAAQHRQVYFLVKYTSRSSVLLGFGELVNRGLPGGVLRGYFHLRALGHLVGRLKLARSEERR